MSMQLDQGSTGAVSFLPSDYIARKTELRNNVITLSLFALVMAGTTAAFLKLQRDRMKAHERYREVTQQFDAESKKIEQLKELEQHRAQLLEKAQITAALIEKVPRWAVLGEMQLRMPTTMRLDQFVLDGSRNEVVLPPVTSNKVRSLTEQAQADQKAQTRPRIVAPAFTYAITMAGITEQNNDVADFLSSLKRSPVFRNVELTYIRDHKAENQVLRKFEITTNLRTDVPEKDLLSSLEALVAQRNGAAAPPQAANPPAAPTPVGTVPPNQE